MVGVPDAVPGPLGPLETERLILRPRSVDDAGLIRRLWTERDPRVPAQRRIGPDGRPTVEDLADDIARRNRTEGDLRLLMVERKDTGEVIGYCGLFVDEPSPVDETDLAYELLRSAQGRGYATEASTAVVDWARAKGYRRLRAGVWDWNVASRRVLSKLGFAEVSVGEPVSEFGRMVRTALDL